jgi:putative intracellular protease/amidase
MYLYVQDTMADWESGFLVAECGSGRFFQSPGQHYSIRLCGRTRNPVRTMGGIRLVPDITIEEIEPVQDNVLVLPGADTWLDSMQDPVIEMVRRLLDTDMVIGAICGATMALAQAGLLNSRPHTSNDPAALKMYCPGYAGERYYINEPAVTDGNLITASGLAAVEFAYHVMKKLGVMRKDALEAWYNLHLTRKSVYFYQLMDATGR